MKGILPEGEDPGLWSVASATGSPAPIIFRAGGKGDPYEFVRFYGESDPDDAHVLIGVEEPEAATGHDDYKLAVSVVYNIVVVFYVTS